MTVTRELEAFDFQCQDIMRYVAEADATELTRLVDTMVSQGNIYVLRGLSSRLADADENEAVHLLAFSVLDQLAAVQDIQVLTNLMTAIQRLEQKGAAWRTPERLSASHKLTAICRSIADMLSEDTQDFEQQTLSQS